MTDDSYVFEGPAEPAAPRDNNPPLSISELSFALKRTLEDRFGHVRLRGEISKVNRHASGHVYLTLKDDKACIDGVVWKGQARGLGVQPETGLEVIVTGKITSYPARSSYQIVIETMEAAGAGALLAQLERLKARLHGEGLFDPARKQPIPAFPAVVGVITSPTGAVIRDILHRIAERWPCRVIVWPVVVQGDAACGQVSNAIRGFDAMRPDGPIPRPDVVIVARGGGSVEDLWCFNDEGLARTVAAARIPIVSAVGHETDTTLIDFVSDRRAPTPTGAAEIVTPVLADLRAAVADLDRRLARAGGRLLEDRRTRLRAAARGLPARPEDLLALPSQRLDHAGSRLASGLHRNLAVHERQLLAAAGRISPALLAQRLDRAGDRLGHAGQRLGAGLSANVAAHEARLAHTAHRLTPAPLHRRLDQRAARLDALADRLVPTLSRRLDRDGTRLSALSRALASLNPKTPKPGFARVETVDGVMIPAAAALQPGQDVRLVFADGARRARIAGGGAPSEAVARPRPASRARAAPPGQGDLF
ncbi:exodeoxyribonuclease VII large subunit [Brevundimonas viscosa]|uniref:Exodeoxyribonuclease 7 large subunit n=1 Tax=Brevundimonas viscosa TaxID=871741 RepID=A0A1I6T1X5_9CAUL|nr:exodeoxyribonuclease VII large subunit [Brevundimonas viscosa]SFS83249.1 Exodeoxyribonuclease VII large subunit [Brevundimonas viscosa]